jgi:hypothetical protein
MQSKYRHSRYPIYFYLQKGCQGENIKIFFMQRINRKHPKILILKMIFLTFLNFLFLNIASACSPN